MLLGYLILDSASVTAFSLFSMRLVSFWTPEYQNIIAICMADTQSIDVDANIIEWKHNI